MAWDGALAGMRAEEENTRQGNLAQLQQMKGSIDILSHFQKQKQEQELRAALANGDTAALMKIPGGIEILGKLATQKNASVTGDLNRARLGEIQRKGEVSNREQSALGALSSLVSGGGFQSNNPGEMAPTQVMSDPAAAERAAMEQYQKDPNTPFAIDVPNPAHVKGLALAAGSALPRSAAAAMLNPGGVGNKPMTDYQQENLRLQEARLNRPEKLVAVPDPNDPSKAVFGPRESGAAAFAPGSGGLLNNQTIRERQLATQLNSTIKPHLDVINSYERFENIRATGDNSQANQFLAMQLMQMSKTGQRALPDKEIQRILGSGAVGGALLGRLQEFLSQAASGRRSTEIDTRMNDLANAMMNSTAERIGQEMKNSRASIPAGANPDNVTGSKPRIYGRYIITNTGNVFDAKTTKAANELANDYSKRSQ